MLRSSCFVNSSTSSFFTIATIIITVTLIDIVGIITAVHSAAFGFVFCNGPILGLWHLIFACSADTDDQWSPNCQTVTLITKLSNDLVAISRDFDCRSLHRIEWQSHPVSKLFWLHVEKTRTKLFLHQLSEVTLLLALAWLGLAWWVTWVTTCGFCCNPEKKIYEGSFTDHIPGTQNSWKLSWFCS